MPDDSIVEYVTLKANGIADVEKQIEKLEKATQRATNQSLALAKSYLDPKYIESLKHQEKARQAAEHIVAAKRQQIRLEEQQHAAAARHAVAVARYGRTGAMVAGGLSRAAPYLGNAAMGLGLGITAGARAGFQGTVEGNRLHNEISQINKELAGAFLPVMKEVTAGMKGLRRVLQSLGPAGQNAVMFGGLAATGYGAYRAYGIGQQVLAHATGQAAASKIAAGTATSTATSAAGGAAGTGATLGLKSAAMGAGVSNPLLALAAVADLTRKAGLMKGVEGVQQRSFSKIASGAINYMSPGTFFTQMATKSAMGGDKGDDAKHRRVTLADAGFEGIGSAYERVSNSAALVGSQNAEDPTTLGDILKWLESQMTRIF